jgi:hypothetical protein
MFAQQQINPMIKLYMEENNGHSYGILGLSNKALLAEH